MPRVVVLNERDEILLVHHNQNGGRDRFWVIPGGDVERGETSWVAALREVREETGVSCRIERLLWLVEEIDTGGHLRQQAFYLAGAPEGEPRPGRDPERPADAQVIDDAGWFPRQRIALLDRVYPEILRGEFWRLRDAGLLGDPGANPVYRVRPSPGFGLP